MFLTFHTRYVVSSIQTVRAGSLVLPPREESHALGTSTTVLYCWRPPMPNLTFPPSASPCDYSNQIFPEPKVRGDIMNMKTEDIKIRAMYVLFCNTEFMKMP